MFQSTIQCHLTGYKDVAIGSAQIAPVGTKFILNSGEMEYSSAFIGKIYQDREYVCVIMCHRGKESTFDFMSAVKACLFKYLPLSSLHLKPVALHIAPDTSIKRNFEDDEYFACANVKGVHIDTCNELISNLTFMFDVTKEELRKLKQYGPGQSDKINICNGIVDEYGDVDVITRKGMYQICETAL